MIKNLTIHEQPLKTFANLERKPESLVGEHLSIRATVTLPEPDFQHFVRNPMEDQDWIRALNALGHNVFAVECEGRDWRVLVRTEGADYARYAARVA